MITKGTTLIIKYEHFTDRDLQYIIKLVHEGFNEELARRLELRQGRQRYKKLHAPLEIKEVRTGQSITLDFNPNKEFIAMYIALRFSETFARIVGDLFEEELKETLRAGIRKAKERFQKRRRKDTLEDLSYD